MSSTTSSAGAWLEPLPSRALPLSFTTRRAPSAAKSSAVARPMPFPAPVITTVRSVRSPMAGSSYHAFASRTREWRALEPQEGTSLVEALMFGPLRLRTRSRSQIDQIGEGDPERRPRDIVEQVLVRRLSVTRPIGDLFADAQRQGKGSAGAGALPG